MGKLSLGCLEHDLRGFNAGVPGDGAGPAQAATGGRDDGQLVRVVHGVTLARPPAVAVVGLRRSGRTGNGENPCGRIAPAYPARAAQFTPEAGARHRAQDDPGHGGARRAPRALEVR